MKVRSYALLIAAACAFSACATDTGTGNEEEQVSGARTSSLGLGLTSFDMETGLSSASTIGDDFYIASAAFDPIGTGIIGRADVRARKWGPVSDLAALVGTAIPPTGWNTEGVIARITVIDSDGFWLQTPPGNVYAVYVRDIQSGSALTFDWVLVSSSPIAPEDALSPF